MQKGAELHNGITEKECLALVAMPKSGASQVHTHLQASMGTKSYYGGMERLKSASKVYYNEFKRDYLDDFILIHQGLGLAMRFNKTFVILYPHAYFNVTVAVAYRNLTVHDLLLSCKVSKKLSTVLSGHVRLCTVILGLINARNTCV